MSAYQPGDNHAILSWVSVIRYIIEPLSCYFFVGLKGESLSVISIIWCYRINIELIQFVILLFIRFLFLYCWRIQCVLNMCKYRRIYWLGKNTRWIPRFNVRVGSEKFGRIRAKPRSYPISPEFFQSVYTKSKFKY